MGFNDLLAWLTNNGVYYTDAARKRVSCSDLSSARKKLTQPLLQKRKSGMHLTRLIYASNHGGMEESAVEDILVMSRANNERDGITGALVVTDEDFMQVLEGDRAAVSKCFMRIMQDDRHQKIQVLLACETQTRLLSAWSMHNIEASPTRQAIMASYLIDGRFEPTQMSQAALENLCLALSEKF